jgi:hypothetical protein
MAKVSVKTRSQAKDTSLPGGYSGTAKATAYFDEPRQPLHLHLLEVQGSESIHVEADGVDKLLYVWSGAVKAGGHPLAKGSSLIVERGAALDVSGSELGAVLLAFSAATAPAKPLPGGNVHLLPAQNAPRSDSLGGTVGLGGVMHADADCPTCQVWLHENRFPGRDIPRSDDEAGVHSHSEDEVIFVIDGEICLGRKLYGPGTALTIAADTLYSFTAGPKGLHFVNFRAGKPGDIQYAKGPPMSETAYWREKLPRPEYLSPMK